MTQSIHPYQVLAMLIQYPATGFMRTLDHDIPKVKKKYPDAMAGMEGFLDYLRTQSETAIQELYIQTFDIQAICNLDVGFILFGEDYKRGEFMAHLKREHRDAGNACGTELPDFLPNILNLLSLIQDESLATELVHTFVVPALDKMLEGFKKGGNVYSLPLQAIQAILKQDFLVSEKECIEQGVAP